MSQKTSLCAYNVLCETVGGSGSKNQLSWGWCTISVDLRGAGKIEKVVFFVEFICHQFLSQNAVFWDKNGYS